MRLAQNYHARARVHVSECAFLFSLFLLLYLTRMLPDQVRQGHSRVIVVVVVVVVALGENGKN